MIGFNPTAQGKVPRRCANAVRTVFIAYWHCPVGAVIQTTNV